MNLFPANRSARVALRMLGPDGTPLARRYYSQEDDRELSAEEMVRGFEVEKGEYVVVTDEELDRLAPDKTRDIDLRRFVDRDSIPPIYFERAYFLTPASDSDKAYRLLAEIMETTNRAGIATFVMRGKEYLVAILAEKGILRAETLRFADELRAPDDIGLPKKSNVDKKLVQRFQKLIDKKATNRFSPEQLKSDDRNRLLKFVQKKRSRGKDVVETEEPEDGNENVVDLMEVLKKSLAQKR